MKAPIFSAYTASKAATADIINEVHQVAQEAKRAAADEYDPNSCPHCGTEPDGCSSCNDTGRRKRGYWNNYGRDWDDSED
jgi:hypothetical protein